MIDIHCHLTQPDFDSDRDEIIEKCKQKLNAIITCCAHPKDFELTMSLVKKYKNFVFATVGIHPEHVKDINDKEKCDFLETIEKNKDSIVGVGEIGLDFWWTKEKEWQQKQKDLFAELIRFAKQLKKPVVIHSRDAHEETIKILESEGAENVVMHMFGANHLVKKIIDNNWFVSLNTIVFRSKKHKKVARDIPIDKLMLETDSPWLGFGERNTPLSVEKVAEKIAEIKKMDAEDVKKITTKNAINFFSLKS